MKHLAIALVLLYSASCSAQSDLNRLLIGTWSNPPFNGIVISRDSIYDAEHFTTSKYTIKRDAISIFHQDELIKLKITFIGKDSFYLGEPRDSTNPVFIRWKK